MKTKYIDLHLVALELARETVAIAAEFIRLGIEPDYWQKQKLNAEQTQKRLHISLGNINNYFIRKYVDAKRVNCVTICEAVN